MNMNPLIKKQVEEFFAKEEFQNFAKHETWEENGEKFSSWQFKSPGSSDSRSLVVRTGDGGAEIMMNEFLKQANDLTKKL